MYVHTPINHIVCMYACMHACMYVDRQMGRDLCVHVHIPIELKLAQRVPVQRHSTALRPKVHTLNGFGTLKPYYLGTWTLRDPKP